MSLMVKHLPTVPETRINPWVRKISWGRKWQPTPVFLPGKSHGQRSLIGLQSMGSQRVGQDRASILGSKFTADGDCSHEFNSHLLLGRKAVTNLDSILKSRDITLQTKVCLVKVMVFLVVMYGCESWTMKKAEC